MIVDPSAIIAMLLREAEADAMVRALAIADVRRLSTGSWIELGTIIIRRRDATLSARTERLVPGLRLQLVPVTPAQATLARDAYRRFGRRSGHRAALNFGDCFSYALAKETGEPLLFKGDNFGHTDITSAL